jgi:hypothetical protein
MTQLTTDLVHSPVGVCAWFCYNAPMRTVHIYCRRFVEWEQFENVGKDPMHCHMVMRGHGDAYINASDIALRYCGASLPVQYLNSAGPPLLGTNSCFSARSGLPGRTTPPLQTMIEADESQTRRISRKASFHCKGVCRTSFTLFPVRKVYVRIHVHFSRNFRIEAYSLLIVSAKSWTAPTLLLLFLQY